MFRVSGRQCIPKTQSPDTYTVRRIRISIRTRIGGMLDFRERVSERDKKRREHSERCNQFEPLDCLVAGQLDARHRLYIASIYSKYKMKYELPR